MGGKLRVSLYAICFLIAASSGAQFLQYIPPGGPETKPQDRKAALEAEIDKARFHLGAIRVAPWFGIRDGAYVRNVFSSGVEPPADYTVTVGAGVRGYLRTGPKVTWKAEVLPEYLYWHKQSERRRLNGSYGLRAFGYFNRLTVEAAAERSQAQRILTPEVPIPATARNDVQQILTEIEVTKLLRPFALLTLTQAHNLVDRESDPRTGSLRTLDRKESVLRAGLRLRLSQDWRIGLGAERSQVDFDRALIDRSNEGTAPFLEVRYERHRLLIEGDVAFRSLKSRLGARLVPYKRPTGGLVASVRMGRRTNLSIYSNRTLVYSLNPEFSYIEDSRLGAGLAVELGSRTATRVFYEKGDNAYTPFLPTTPGRTDDYENYGATINFNLTPGLSLGINAISASYDSRIPGGDRTYRAVGANLNFGAR